jgi:hypothetical protein
MGAAFSFELEQGRSIYQFLKENVKVPIYYQRKLTARESMFLRFESTGEPRYFILPYPYSFDRQLACLHEYGHYLDGRPLTDVNHRANLTKPKAVRTHAGIRKHFTQAEIEAWDNAIITVHNQKWKIPQDVYVDLIANFGLRTYYDLWTKDGGLPKDLEDKFNWVFGLINHVSPGFTQLPAIQNYFSS